MKRNTLPTSNPTYLRWYMSPIDYVVVKDTLEKDVLESIYARTEYDVLLEVVGSFPPCKETGRPLFPSVHMKCTVLKEGPSKSVTPCFISEKVGSDGEALYVPVPLPFRFLKVKSDVFTFLSNKDGEVDVVVRGGAVRSAR